MLSIKTHCRVAFTSLLSGAVFVSVLVNVVLLHERTFLNERYKLARLDASRLMKQERSERRQQNVETAARREVSGDALRLLTALYNCAQDKLKDNQNGGNKDGQPDGMTSRSPKYLDLENISVPELRMKVGLERRSQAESIRFLSEPIINDHTFGGYTHNPLDSCTAQETEVLFLVPSAPGNFDKRKAVREGARGIYVRELKNKARMLFFLGLTDVNMKADAIFLQNQINAEAGVFKDIVQENFIDTYTKIRLKSVSMLKWASTYCKETKFVIRTDDDVEVDPRSLVDAVAKGSEQFSDFIVGKLKVYEPPARNLKSKYYTSYEDYPFSFYPPFVLGGALGFPISTVKLLYQASLRLKPFWLDDVFITGLCAEKLKIPRISIVGFEFSHKKLNE